MNKQERKDVAKAFKAAQKYLWNGKIKNPMRFGECVGICACLRKARVNGEIGYQAKRLAQDIISDRLGDHAYVTGWLKDEAGIPERQLTKPRVQAWRLKWLEKLHKEFKK